MTDEMTREAKEILKAAVAGDGSIMYLRAMGHPGVAIQVETKNFIPDGANHKTVAFWIGGLEDLQEAGYIRETGSDGDLFEVTREGYIAADGLS